MNRTFSIASFAILRPGETPDVSAIPPLARRRLSPLQKIYFALASRVETSPAALAVFASRDGEDSLTRRLVDDFNADGSVSPHRFSTSVYNAAPGLWSVHTRNRAPYTAVAAGADTIEAGLLEALAGPVPALFVSAEETEGGYGAAVLFASGETVRVTGLEGRSPQGPITFPALTAFLEGASDTLVGRHIALARRAGF